MAARLDAAVRQRWQPRVRRQRREHVGTSIGVIIETRAGFGYTPRPSAPPTTAAYAT
ncbi:hypothetical protein [Streptomyces sp. enrichment culture]|uniref:hypothetical protein n=1 Tax=Streptomyces sp. enrichment culture TaxID=1795815 RepID=UPI003F56CFBC